MVGGQFDYSKLANLSEVNRATVKAHIEAMQVARAMRLVRPFHGGGTREITGQPKCYAFDTGLVAFARGWDSVHDGDRGLLWEHLVLDSLCAGVNTDDIYYSQDKSRHEIDFMVRRRANRADVVECKIDPGKIEASPVQAFRGLYANGENILVSPAVKQPYKFRRGDLVFTACNTKDYPR